MSAPRVKFSEILAQLKLDASLRLLLVEGLRDFAFVHRIVNVQECNSLLIYTSGNMEVEGCAEGGERGRAIKVANDFAVHGYSARVVAFVDADEDHLLNISYGDNVVFTDFRDLEAFGLELKVVERIYLDAFARVGVDVESVVEKLIEDSLYIAAVRLYSKVDNLNLPVNAVVDKVRRCLDRDCCFDRARFLRAILSKKYGSISSFDECNSEIQQCQYFLKLFDPRRAVRGKDWVALLAQYLDQKEEMIEALVFTSINYEFVIECDNISRLVSFMRTENK